MKSDVVEVFIVLAIGAIMGFVVGAGIAPSERTYRNDLDGITCQARFDGFSTKEFTCHQVYVWERVHNGS